MPISNNASYLPAFNEFIAHWGQVNAVLDPDLIVVAPDQSAMTLAGFTTLRNTLQTQLQTVIGFLNDKQIARGDIELRKKAMLGRLNEFIGLLEGYWMQTPFFNARPYAPNLTAGEEVFIKPMRDMVSLWGKLNPATAPAGIDLPLVLSDGTVVEDFQEEISGLQTAYATEAKANQDAVLARSHRDATKATAKALMITYRKVVPSRCAQHPSLVETLPAVTPPPGHTPQPVNASAAFQAPDQAKVVYAASAEAMLARYELRGNPGDAYSEEDAVVIAIHQPGDPREFLTNFALTQPGMQVALKVFVVLTSGNEAGGAEMIVTRPAAGPLG